MCHALSTWEGRNALAQQSLKSEETSGTGGKKKASVMGLMSYIVLHLLGMALAAAGRGVRGVAGALRE